ncbi:MAG: hypothetical protein GY797_01985, partial [Deltaproteobacteria bacterium]|nr:hypothetical protein [Deltaproteobacteria bacterium]
AVTSGDEVINAIHKKQERDRKVFAEKIAAQTRSAMEHINNNYSRYLEGLKANQLIEQQLMKERHTQDSQRRAKDIASGKAKEEFDRHHKMKESFQKMQEPQNDNKPPPDLKEDFNNEKKGSAECMVSKENEKAKLKANQSVASKTHGLEHTPNKLDQSEVEPEFKQQTPEEEKKPLQQKIATPEMEHVLNPPGMVQQKVNTEHVSPSLREKNVVENNDDQKEFSGVKTEFDFVNDNLAKETNDQKEDTEIKEEFNYVNDDFLDKSNDKEKGKDSGRFTNSDIGKDGGMEHG